ncbi:hypothetical protein [Acinetobacter baumannii]|uniref:hypothetical protein n=1 Tax=Acinetobacter baumannii TaxID=470 RepID=UPI0025A21A43|nr:hypothetical protein [Acinetobacter baumannii]
MKPEQFIREYGVEKAREVVEGIPKAKSFISGDVKEAQGYNSKLSKYVMWDWLSGRPPHPREVELRRAIRDHESIYGGSHES